MGRPRKKTGGIEYFPFDCDFFEDDKVEYVLATAGADAILGYQRLLCAIYRVGLCWRYGRVEKVAYAKRSGVKLQTADKWLSAWLDSGLFDPDVYEQTGFLTSKAVQRRYLEITRGRVEMQIPEGVLLVPTDEIPQTMTISYIKVKVKGKVKGNSQETPTIPLETTKKPLETPNSSERGKKKANGERENTRNYGDHVYLKPEEMVKLIREFGKKHVVAKITALESGIENGIRKYVAYKNHYKTILSWLRSDAASGKITPEPLRRLPETFASQAEARRVVGQLFNPGDVKTIK